MRLALMAIILAISANAYSYTQNEHSNLEARGVTAPRDRPSKRIATSPPDQPSKRIATSSDPTKKLSQLNISPSSGSKTPSPGRNGGRNQSPPVNLSPDPSSSPSRGRNLASKRKPNKYKPSASERSASPEAATSMPMGKADTRSTRASTRIAKKKAAAKQSLNSPETGTTAAQGRKRNTAAPNSPKSPSSSEYETSPERVLDPRRKVKVRRPNQQQPRPSNSPERNQIPEPNRSPSRGQRGSPDVRQSPPRADGAAAIPGMPPGPGLHKPLDELTAQMARKDPLSFHPGGANYGTEAWARLNGLRPPIWDPAADAVRERLANAGRQPNTPQAAGPQHSSPVDMPPASSIPAGRPVVPGSMPPPPPRQPNRSLPAGGSMQGPISAPRPKVPGSMPPPPPRPPKSSLPAEGSLQAPTPAPRTINPFSAKNTMVGRAKSYPPPMSNNPNAPGPSLAPGQPQSIMGQLASAGRPSSHTGVFNAPGIPPAMSGTPSREASGFSYAQKGGSMVLRNKPPFDTDKGHVIATGRNAKLPIAGSDGVAIGHETPGPGHVELLAHNRVFAQLSAHHGTKGGCITCKVPGQPLDKVQVRPGESDFGFWENKDHPNEHIKLNVDHSGGIVDTWGLNHDPN